MSLTDTLGRDTPPPTPAPPPLQAFNLIRYFGGQHSILVTPQTL
jgi:hypothetical protein